MEKNYYQLFGIAQTASLDEIKKSYRILALKYHPDKHGGDQKYEQIFKKINHIYEVLSDDDKRSRYDYELNNISLDEQALNAENFDPRDFKSAYVSSDPFRPMWESKKPYGNAPPPRAYRPLGIKDYLRWLYYILFALFWFGLMLYLHLRQT